ncbi:MAG: bifunctional chorismate mutase/prephenate dehydratase, partial [Clostridia bacterium]
MSETLLEVRNEIDKIDKQLLPLFLERMKCSEDVVRIKMRENLPILNKKREEEIIEEVAEKSGDMAEYAKVFFSNLMAISKVRQQDLLTKSTEIDDILENSLKDFPENPSVLCQGTKGAYSHKAANIIFPNANISFQKSFEDVFKGIENNEADFAVLPVENSSAGSVSDVYSLIMKYKFFIVSAVKLRVKHCVASHCDDFDTVISHPQALMQCSNYISQNNLVQKEYANTALAAEYVSQNKDKKIAAICSEDAAKKYGLKIIETNIQNDKNNNTRFAVISKTPIFVDEADKVSLCLSLENKAGSLYKMLERFALSGLNLSKIESRNISGTNFEYDFYLDFSGSIRDK